MGEDANAWAEQMEAMAKAWTQAQKTAWEQWSELMRLSPASAPAQERMIEQWNRLAREGFEAWTANAGATAKGAAKRLFTGHEIWLRSLELASQAWSAIVAKVEAGENWQAALAQYTDSLRQRLTQSPENIFKTTQDLGELWLLYIEEFKKLAQPWMASWQQAESHLGAAARGDGSALFELSKLYWDSLDQTAGKFLQSPGLGSSRELNEKFIKGFQAWQELREATAAYQAILAEASTRVLEQSLNEMAAIAERGESIQSVREWVLPLERVADPVLTEIFGSDEFVRTQGRLLNASMSYWICHREIVEQFLKAADIPTRSEIDEIHQTVYLQRKEIKALKKTVAELTARIGRLAVDRDSEKGELQTPKAQAGAGVKAAGAPQKTPARKKKVEPRLGRASRHSAKE